MTQLTSHAQAVASVLAGFTFTDLASLDAGAATLSGLVAQSMTATAAYQLPAEATLPQGQSVEQAFVLVHPHNIAAALLSVIHKRNELAPQTPMGPEPSLQVFAGAWVPITQVSAQLIVVNVIAPVAPAPVVPAAPTPAPVAPAPVAAPAPAVPTAPPLAAESLSSMVDEALAAPVQAAVATPAPVVQAAPVVAVAEPVDAAPVAPHTVPATPSLPIDSTATHVQAPQAPQEPVAPQAAAVAADAGAQLAGAGSGLPNASVTLERTGTSGRPQQSPFGKEVKARAKVADAPFWWAPLLHSAKRLFTESPAQALDPSSDGAGPVQSYAVLIELMRQTFERVPGDISVAELRLYLDEVATDIAAQKSGEAINQLVSKLFD